MILALSQVALALPTTPVWQVTHGSPPYAWTRPVAGNLDGDGYAELVLGPVAGGSLLVYNGGATGPSALPATTLTGPVLTDFATDFAFAEDVDGDGFGDMLIGTPLYSEPQQPEEGVAEVMRGGPVGLASTPFWSWEPDLPYQWMGRAVTSCDLDGDSHSDVVLGHPSAGVSAEGSVLIFLGGPSGPSSSPDLVLQGEQPFAGFGQWVSCVGDTNGDGLSELGVGSPGANYLEIPTMGRAQIFSQLDPTPLWRVDGTHLWDGFGEIVGPGDLNGDGFDDVVVTAPYEDSAAFQEGAVRVYLGGPAGPGLAPSLVLSGSQQRSRFGSSVAGGDTDGDGIADLLVGVPAWDDAAGEDEGLLHLFLGGTGGLLPLPAWTVTGGTPGIMLGWRVALADLTGDGRTEAAGVAQNGQDVHAYVWADLDRDLDGIYTPDDCDDEDPTSFPGAEDLPGDGIDQDCDGEDAVIVDTSDTGSETPDPGASPEDEPVNESGCGCTTSGGAGWPVFLLLALIRRRTP